MVNFFSAMRSGAFQDVSGIVDHAAGLSILVSFVFCFRMTLERLRSWYPVIP